MLEVLPSHPVLDIHALDRIFGGERVPLYRMSDRLAATGVVQEATGFESNRVWFAPDLFELLEEVERESVSAAPHPADTHEDDSRAVASSWSRARRAACPADPATMCMNQPT